MFNHIPSVTEITPRVYHVLRLLSTVYSVYGGVQKIEFYPAINLECIYFDEVGVAGDSVCYSSGDHHLVSALELEDVSCHSLGGVE